MVHEVGVGVTGWMVGDAVFGEGCGTFVDDALALPDQLAALRATRSSSPNQKQELRPLG